MRGYPTLSWHGMSSDLNSQLRSLRVVLLQGYRPKGFKIPVAPKTGCTALLQLFTDRIKG